MPEHCLTCLRYAKSKKRCLVFNKFQSPCWAYTDDPVEFGRREKERRAYESMCHGIARLA